MNSVEVPYSELHKTSVLTKNSVLNKHVYYELNDLENVNLFFHWTQWKWYILFYAVACELQDFIIAQIKQYVIH